MELKPRISELLWMGAGATVLLVVVAIALLFRNGTSPIGRLELGARRVRIVEQMRFSLAAASEAEKSAVLAVTDQDSKTYADEARAATAEVDRLQEQLGDLLDTDSGQSERDLLAAFSKAFAQFQRVDRELLALAVRNTNLKAFDLAYGPAARASKETDAALSRFLSRHATSPQKVLLLAAGARAAALRLETRLAPHIAEASDQKMDEMERLMAGDDRELREALDGLDAQTGLRADPDLAAARSSWARFSDLRMQILALSRENTNVRSLNSSLNEKRKVTLDCQDALYALRQAIADEPTPATPPNPRRLSPGTPPPG